MTLSIVVLWMLLLAVRGKLINRTIDDIYGDQLTGKVPIYDGDSGWNANNQSCTTCVHHPDPTQLFRGTWHDGYSYEQKRINITILFTGVAIYTIFVLFGNTGDLTQVRFTLDGNQMGGFLHNDSLPGLPAGTTPTYLYNQTIFSKTGLSNSEHVLSLIADGNSDKPSVMLFDYAIYTQDIAEKKDQRAVIRVVVGGVVIGCALLVLLVLLYVWIRKRRKKRARAVVELVPQEEPTPLVLPSSPSSRGITYGTPPWTSTHNPTVTPAVNSDKANSMDSDQNRSLEINQEELIRLRLLLRELERNAASLGAGSSEQDTEYNPWVTEGNNSPLLAEMAALRERMNQLQESQRVLLDEMRVNASEVPPMYQSDYSHSVAGGK